MKEKLLNFLEIFQLETALVYPDLFNILDEMTERIIDEVLKEEEVVDITTHILQKMSDTTAFF